MADTPPAGVPLPGGLGVAQLIGKTPAEGVRLTRLEVGEDEFLILSVASESRVSLEELTAAEREVLRLLLRGLSNAEIAAERRTAERTVANQIGSIFRKLEVFSRAELVASLTGAGKP